MVSAKEQYKIEYGRCGVGEKCSSFREGGDICTKNERVRKQAVLVYEGRTFRKIGWPVERPQGRGVSGTFKASTGWGRSRRGRRKNRKKPAQMRPWRPLQGLWLLFCAKRGAIGGFCNKEGHDLTLVFER